MAPTDIPLHHEFPSLYVYVLCIVKMQQQRGERISQMYVFGANTLLVQTRNGLTFNHPEVVNKDRTHFSGVDARWITHRELIISQTNALLRIERGGERETNNPYSLLYLSYTLVTKPP
jgi:hypothetical protein